MSYTDSDAAFNYALVLAFRHHILEEENRRGGLGFGPNQGDAETIEFQDSLANLQQIRTFVFNKLLTYYMDQDTAPQDPEQQHDLQKSLAYNFPEILLKPAATEGVRYDTVSMIDRLDREEPARVLRLDREGELGPRFYLILKKVIELHDTLHLPTTDTINVYAAEYIQRILANYTEFFDESTTLLMKLDAASAFLARDYEGPKGSIDTLFALFKLHLSSHIEFAKYDLVHGSEQNLNYIYLLREQGNNLMAVQSFPQAILVYTVALENVTFQSSSNIPQLLTNRALAYIALNCFPEAIIDLNAAVHHERSFTAAWTQLGYCHLYMGKSLLALRAYLVALRTTVGEILPNNFPNDAVLVAKYRATKVKSVLPQFIQRLCLSISLTETRAYQQTEPAPEIRKIVSNVRKILAVLRAECSDQDREFFSYFPHLRDNMFRSMSERASRNRNPGQNQVVHQNAFGNTGDPMAVGVSEVAPTLATLDPATDPFAAETTAERGRQNTRPPQAAAANGLRHFLNDFGELFEQGTEQRAETPVQPQTDIPNAGQPPTEQPPRPPNQSNMIFQNVLRNVLPAGFGGVGEMLAQISGNGTTSRVVVNGEPVDIRPATTQPETDRPSDAASEANTPSTAPPNGEDVEMQQVPEDLD